MFSIQEYRSPQQISSIPEKLLFQAPDDRWAHLPEWAQAFMLFGHQLGSSQIGEHRRVLALNLPCRDFAALFITAGLVSARLARRLTPNEQALHLEMLCGLPVGTGVMIWQGGKRQRGTILSHSRNDPNRQLRIQTGRRDAVTIIGLQSANLVEPLDWEVHPSGSHLSTALNLFLFSQHDTEAQSRSHAWTDGLLISNTVQLEQEASLKLRRDVSALDGTLADLCAVDAFVSSAEIRRTVLLPSLGDEPSARQLRSNTVVIFDGSNAFVRHHHALPNHDQVVLISPDDARHSEAIAGLNSAFASRLDNLDCPLDGVPDGVDVMAWTERRHAD